MHCQKCRSELKLDDSLQKLNSGAVDLLLGRDGDQAEPELDLLKFPYPADRESKYRLASANSGSPLFKRTVQSTRRGIALRPKAPLQPQPRENASMSFVILSDSQLQQQTVGSRYPAQDPEESSKHPPITDDTDTHSLFTSRTQYSTRLFELLSSRSDVDHPICSDCTDLLMSSFQARLASSLKERDAYIGFLKDLTNKTPTEEQVTRASNELAEAVLAEDHAYAELLSLEREKAELEQELARLDAESRILDTEERDFWKVRNALDQKLLSHKDVSEALKASIAHDTQQLARLERTNVYNDTFFISHDGPFGTINGLRLGRLPPPNNVEWPEINAAWGTTILLIATVADRLKFSFRGYHLKPVGSVSYIEKINESQVVGDTNRTSSGIQNRTKPILLELFSSGDLPLGRQILHRRFNEAMVAFLECLRQLCEHVHLSNDRSRRPEGVSLPPYKIDKDKINGVSIKLGVSQDESWTTACKYTLTCCKFLLAHISNVGE